MRAKKGNSHLEVTTDEELARHDCGCGVIRSWFGMGGIKSCDDMVQRERGFMVFALLAPSLWDLSAFLVGQA